MSTEAELPTTEATETADGAGKTPLGRLRSLAPVVAAALCIPCVVLLVVFLMRLHSRSAADDARADAARSARTAAPELLAYDYRRINDDVAQAKKLVTKPFSSQYAQTAATLQSEAVRLKAIVQADVKTVAVEDATRSRVVVLLFVDQSSVKQLPGQSKPVTRVDEQRVRFTMVKSHGQWLVSEVAALI
jgi:Mce-associated membrane protein